MRHKFVDYIPDNLEYDCLYITFEFSTAVHKCVCGCGNEVVTPFSPTDWALTYNGESVSLYPSIGNWNFECKSHYWIKKGKVIHCSKWENIEIKDNRTKNKWKKKKFFHKFLFFIK